MAKKTEYIQRITVSDGNGNVQDLVVVTPEVFEKMAKNMRKNFRFLDDRIVLATTKGVENARPEFEIADNWTADNRYKYEIESGESLPTLFGKIKRWLYNLSKLAFTGAWGDIQNKPSTFAPSSHNHNWSEINNKPSYYNPSSHTHSWSDITGKPSAYPPSSHTHNMGQITGLNDELSTITSDIDELYNIAYGVKSGLDAIMDYNLYGGYNGNGGYTVWLSIEWKANHNIEEGTYRIKVSSIPHEFRTGGVYRVIFNVYWHADYNPISRTDVYFSLYSDDDVTNMIKNLERYCRIHISNIDPDDEELPEFEFEYLGPEE